MAELVVVVCGLIGSGKSEVSKKLAELTHLPGLNSDLVRLEITGGVRVYSSEETALTYRTMIAKADYLLGTGERGVIFDGSFRKQRERDLAKGLSEKYKARFKLIHVICSDETLVRDRLEQRKKRGHDASEAGWSSRQKLLNSFDPIQESHLQIDNLVGSVEKLGDLVTRLALPYVLSSN